MLNIIICFFVPLSRNICINTGDFVFGITLSIKKIINDNEYILSSLIP